MPFQDDASKPGKPLSDMVGTFGRAGNLFLPIKTMGLSELPFKGPSKGVKISTPKSIFFPITAEITSPLDLKGIIVKSALTVDLKSSAARFCVLPILILPAFNCPGLRFARLIKSWTELIFELELTTIAISKNPIVETCVKSLVMSNGKFLNNVFPSV